MSDESLGERVKRLEGELKALRDDFKFSIYDLHRHAHYEASRDSAAYMVEFMQGVPRFEVRADLFAHIKSVLENTEGDVLEFGVSGGVSLGQFGELFPDRQIFGFDSFEGLPDDWALTVKKGAYAIPREKIKRVPLNATLVEGWFEHSVPRFLETFQREIALIHIDCDIYSSTVTVLNSLSDRIRPGCVIEFDEYFNYSGWRHHEWKAWQEFVDLHTIQYEYIGYTRRDKCVAVRVNKIGR